MDGQNEKVFKIGSRKSQLAMIQTQWVVQQLGEVHKDKKLSFEIVGISTTGDKILDVALAKIGEKSLFTKELEIALLKNEIDFVVHSLKDLPTQLPEGLSIAAISKREDPRDAVLFNPKFSGHNLASLPPGSNIGTSSLRRIAQLKNRYPHLTFIDVRGNLNTRLRKLDDPNGEYAALILAAAGVKRMDWEHRIEQFLEPEDCMYAVGQGALAIECASENQEVLELLRPLTDSATYMCCLAERTFLRTLEGGCSVPVAVSTNLQSTDKTVNLLEIRGSVWNLDGSKSVCHSLQIDLSQENENPEDIYNLTSVADQKFSAYHNCASKYAASLGNKLGLHLMQLGAKAILNEVKLASQKEIDVSK